MRPAAPSIHAAVGAALVALATVAAPPAAAQHPASPPADSGAAPRMTYGTAWLPDAVAVPTREASLGSWDLMWHGTAFAQVDAQGGPRGGTQIGSLSWGMLMAAHRLGAGRVELRAMASLDPAGVTARGYPLLLQTGEAWRNVPLVDRQHPHDAVMELAALYERRLTRSVWAQAYVAPVGDPAVGPVAFMHRPSALDNPAAPLGHHWQDATHVSAGVVTAGLFTPVWKVEGSAFNGREPDDRRWSPDPIRLDSWAGRLTINPAARWSLSASWAFLATPEALAPDESQHRMTAAAMYGRPLGAAGQWAATAIWGADAIDGRVTHSLLAEAEVMPGARYALFGRAERAPRTAGELSLAAAPALPPDRPFAVGAYTLGAVRELARMRGVTIGLGGMVTLNVVPAALRAAYGSREPMGGMVFLRARVAGSGQDAMAGMNMPGM